MSFALQGGLSTAGPPGKPLLLSLIKIYICRQAFNALHIRKYYKHMYPEEGKILRSFSAAAAAKSLQSCLTLCDRIDGSPPGSPVPGILQARTLEWGAISFSNA